jgi:hypothetical protein
MQNAYYHGGGKAPTAGSSSGPASSMDRSGETSSGETDAPLGQSLGIAASIDNLQGSMKNMNVVHFPPFFPIATYQRVDLVLQINQIQDQIRQSSLASDIKQVIPADDLNKDATDQELGAAIGRLFDVRDTLTKDSNLSTKNAEPGAILTTKV